MINEFRSLKTFFTILSYIFKSHIYFSRIFFKFFILSVAKLAKEEIAPLVRKMEKEGKIDDGVLKMLFENGVS